MPRNLFGKETKIEKKVRKLLNELKEQYRINHTIKGGFNVDFFIPELNLIIECYGDYFHANPKKYIKENYDEIQTKNTIRDEKKMPFFNSFYNYMIFWEEEINKRSFRKVFLQKYFEAKEKIFLGEKYKFYSH